MVPVTTQVDRIVWDHNEMERARRDRVVTSGADVLLHRLRRLDGADRNPEKIAHAMTANVARMATTTMTMSIALLSCSRNGLKPTSRR
jgi:hypothetical protein